LKFEISRNVYEKFLFPPTKEHPLAKLRQGWGKMVDSHFENIDFPCSFNVILTNIEKRQDFRILGYCNDACPTKYDGSIGARSSKGSVSCELTVCGDCKLVQSKASGRR
jgi:hypothetical protein